MTLNITPDSASGVPVKAVGPSTTLRDIRKGVSLLIERNYEQSDIIRNSHATEA